MTSRSISTTLILALACGAWSSSTPAQGILSDAQVQAAFGPLYDHLGLMEYCQAKGFATSTDVANTRKTVVAATHGFTVSASAQGEEAVGRRGTIVGEQIIGLMDASNPARPEVVPAGTTMSLADNARAQKTTEKDLCGQMAAQVAPLP